MLSRVYGSLKEMKIFNRVTFYMNKQLSPAYFEELETKEKENVHKKENIQKILTNNCSFKTSTCLSYFSPIKIYL